MVDTLAGYIVTAAQYDESGTRLRHIFVGFAPEHPSMTVEGIRLLSRAELMDALRAGRRFFISYKQSGEWNNGGEIRVVEHAGEPYLRIDETSEPIDDLGNLAKIRP